ITLSDGEVKEVDLSALITQYEFVDSGTIAYTVYPDGRVTFAVKEGSIEERHLRPNYLADIKVEVAKAKSSADNAAENAEESKNSALKAESYAHGGTGKRENENTDNAKYYSEQAKASAEKASNIVTQNVVLQSEKGVANGVASLGSDGKVPSSQLPSFDGGVTGVKGSAEAEYRTGNVNITKTNIGLGNVGNFKAVSTVASQGLTDAEKANVRENIGIEAVSKTSDGLVPKLPNETTTTKYFRQDGTWQMPEVPLKTANCGTKDLTINPNGITRIEWGGPGGAVRVVDSQMSWGGAYYPAYWCAGASSGKVIMLYYNDTANTLKFSGAQLKIYYL
ncbi:MAG: hypothetical protein HDQ95_05820, partial [Roseburia sp.]|nr:hypothetical protein [Roseburia sp.]